MRYVKTSKNDGLIAPEVSWALYYIVIHRVFKKHEIAKMSGGQESRFRYVMCRMLKLFYLRAPLNQYLYFIET